MAGDPDLETFANSFVVWVGSPEFFAFGPYLFIQFDYIDIVAFTTWFTDFGYLADPHIGYGAKTGP